MVDWLRSQDWTLEFWVVLWFAVFVLVGLVAGFYRGHPKR